MFDMQEATGMDHEQRENIMGYHDKEKFALHSSTYSLSCWKMHMNQESGREIWQIPFIYNSFEEEDSEDCENELERQK